MPSPCNRMTQELLAAAQVNSFGSGAQAIVVFLLLPGLAALRGIYPSQLPSYLAEGASCLRGITPACASDCSLAPVLAASYVACNLGLNIAALALLRKAGAGVGLLAGCSRPQAHAPDRCPLCMRQATWCRA